MKKNLIWCQILAAVAIASATDYCQMNCTLNGNQIGHVACVTAENLGGDCPKSANEVNITQGLQNVFLHEFNDFRNFAAGGGIDAYNNSFACRMATIQWDSELAQHAARNSRLCKKWYYDNCHTTETFARSGQVVFVSYVADFAIVDEAIYEAMLYWKEIALAEQYSDLVADKNIRVGCGITGAYYERRLNEYWVVCNFATDIQDDETVYEVCESAAEKCMKKPVDPYPNLCGLGEIYE